MSDQRHTSSEDRLRDLLADERLGQLSPEDRAELDSLMEQGAGAQAEAIARRLDRSVGEALVEIDQADHSAGMPAHMRERLLARAPGAAVAPAEPAARAGRIGNRSSAPAVIGWLAAAACLLLALGAGVFAVSAMRGHEAELAELRSAMQVKAEENERLLAAARQEISSFRDRYSELERVRLDLTQRLADATSDLEQAELTIARYEQPADPAELARNRELLLEVPDTIRVAWQPFDVPGLPETEQRNVQGDVVWNDELQQGYLRFVGLEPNDPSVEQYQVWVIDERGMEQKVSGGVFNASAEGEIIVPIEPGIDVGRVALFAVTVENPGGTWVPDLSRRVVIAPRDS